MVLIDVLWCVVNRLPVRRYVHLVCHGILQPEQRRMLHYLRLSSRGVVRQERVPGFFRRLARFYLVVEYISEHFIYILWLLMMTRNPKRRHHSPPRPNIRLIHLSLFPTNACSPSPFISFKIAIFCNNKCKYEQDGKALNVHLQRPSWALFTIWH